ncbi:hypothetical protein [Clostridium estertheticum]|uniref:hypothetical protein n=1 Tax=Clostridium estertheticum TaxID=238834 RepID=UPI0039A5424F
MRRKRLFELWKRNLIVCWFGIFIASVGMSQIAPVLPLYINHLGITDTASIAQLSGFAFGITYIISAIFSSIWGQAADKYGRKPMLLRASLGFQPVFFITGALLLVSFITTALFIKESFIFLFFIAALILRSIPLRSRKICTILLKEPPLRSFFISLQFFQ